MHGVRCLVRWEGLPVITRDSGAKSYCHGNPIGGPLSPDNTGCMRQAQRVPVE